MYVQSMISQQTETQTKSRSVNYVGTGIKKFPVPEDMASWDVSLQCRHGTVKSEIIAKILLI